MIEVEQNGSVEQTFDAEPSFAMDLPLARVRVRSQAGGYEAEETLLDLREGRGAEIVVALLRSAPR